MIRHPPIIALSVLMLVCGSQAFADTPVTASSPGASAAPLYYQDPDGRPFYAAKAKATDDGRPYVAVYTDGTILKTAMAATQTMPPSAASRKIAYYRNPMGLPDTSPVPKKDSMGMDYIAVYADDAADPGTVRVSPETVQTLGVRTETVAVRNMTRAIRAVGTVAIDESRIAVVSPKFEGWIENLEVNTTGQPVKRGEQLFNFYSPELVLAEQEYLVARQSLGGLANADPTVRTNAEGIADSALSRLRNLDVAPAQLAQLRKSGAATRSLSVYAPMDGVVLEKTAVEGMRFAPGDTLYRIADLSTIWVLANVFEQDLGQIQPDQKVSVTVPAYPGRTFQGRVAFIYPTIDAATRTAKVRIVIPNTDLLLKAEMYATVEVAAPVGGAATLAVPESSVLDTGREQTVLVDRGGGKFQPKRVHLGPHAGGYVAVIDGVEGGEKVVVNANFLIDAESNLRTALQAFTAPAPEKTP